MLKAGHDVFEWRKRPGYRESAGAGRVCSRKGFGRGESGFPKGERGETGASNNGGWVLQGVWCLDFCSNTK